MIVTSAIWLAFVTAALVPPFRHGRSGFVVFVATMVFNELPSLLLVVFGVSIVFSGRPAGAAESLLAAALVAPTVAGLVWLQVRARSARLAFHAALDDGLGERWRTDPRTAGTPESLRRTPWALGILLPFQRRNRHVIRRRNLAYGPDPAHTVDVYFRQSTSADRPVLIHLHGGGFVSGRKSREAVTLLNRLAEHGWVCLSGNYRLRGNGQHPNPVIDAKRLVAWVRENADALGADPSLVFLAGCSAGAHVAICSAMTANDAELQPGFEAADTSVAGVVAFYGYLGPRTSDPSSSPALLATSIAPPLLIVHGTNDTAVPVEDARAVAEALRRKSRRPVVFVALPGTQHSFDRFASVRSRTAAEGAEAFLTFALHASC